MRVLRSDPYLIVDGVFYLIKDIARACDLKSKQKGVRFPGSERPPFFYSGCPYADAINDLAVKAVEPPRSEIRIQFLPKPTRTPSQGQQYKRIAERFGYDAELQYQ